MYVIWKDLLIMLELHGLLDRIQSLSNCLRKGWRAFWPLSNPFRKQIASVSKPRRGFVRVCVCVYVCSCVCACVKEREAYACVYHHVWAKSVDSRVADMQKSPQGKRLG